MRLIRWGAMIEQTKVALLATYENDEGQTEVKDCKSSKSEIEFLMSVEWCYQEKYINKKFKANGHK